MRLLRSASRGQSIAESTLFLPLVLLVLFGTIFASQYGVLAERTQLAVRYGGLIGSSSLFSATSIYNFYSTPSGSLASCPSPPAGIVTDTAPLPGPITAAYFQPSEVDTSCTPVAHSVGGAQFLAYHIYAASQNTASTKIPVFSYLRNVIGSDSMVVGASEPFAHAADPSAILYCSQEVRSRVRDAVLGALQPAPAPTPTPSGSPPPLAFNC